VTYNESRYWDAEWEDADGTKVYLEYKKGITIIFDLIRYSELINHDSSNTDANTAVNSEVLTLLFFKKKDVKAPTNIYGMYKDDVIKLLSINLATSNDVLELASKYPDTMADGTRINCQLIKMESEVKKFAFVQFS
jgi:hypothetical protein